jgi:tryptophan halogenase
MINSVVIAGGGAAGWMTAAYLKRAFPKLQNIIVVESPAIGAVGVGEASFSTFKLYCDFLGLKETEWMPACNATYKLGVKFVDWTRERGSFYHPFQRFEVVKGFDAAEWWLKLRPCANFDQACFTTPLLCETNRSPRFMDGTVFDEKIQGYFGEESAANNSLTHHAAQYPYGYHFDALLLAEYLKKYSISSGVEHVADDIVGVNVTDDGAIGSLDTKLHGRIAGDLFIDCTGFRALLIGKTLGVRFEDWSHWLPTDSALAVQTRATGSPPPYTRAIAHRAGWRWKIPLQHRVGNGLVYSSARMSDEEARRLLDDSISGEILIQPRLIRFKAGYRRKVWVKNCIAIGLSSGFVEPLESTSIHLIMIAVTRLLQAFPLGGVSSAVAERFNAQSSREIEGIRDFIVLHYHLTERNDSDFWRGCREMSIPDSLAERIALFRDAAHAYQDAHDLFRVDSWVQVMLGQRLSPRSHHPAAQLMPEAQLRDALASLTGNIARAVAAMPTHEAWLVGFAVPDRESLAV